MSPDLKGRVTGRRVAGRRVTGRPRTLIKGRDLRVIGRCFRLREGVFTTRRLREGVQESGGG